MPHFPTIVRLFSYLAVFVVLVAGCQEGGFRPTQQLVTSTLKLDLKCAGQGEPLILLLPGLSGKSSNWSQVRDRGVQNYRVCALDFESIGPVVTGDDIVTAASRALQNEGVSKNIVLVAHSFGGYLAQLLYQSSGYGEAGVVLVESSHPDMLQAYKPLVSSEAYLSMRQFVSEHPNGIDLIATESSVKKADGFGAVPLVVLSRGKRGHISDLSRAENERVDLAWAALQGDLMRLSSRSEKVIAENAGHNVPLDDPEAVLAAIVRLTTPP